MKRGSALFLKVLILLIALGALVGMIQFPQTEGRATNLDLISIYTDPFILYMYLSSIPFFVALYQAFILSGYIEKNNMFSQAAVKAVRNIKYCAIILIGFMAAAILYIRVMANATHDDPVGGIATGIVLIFASAIVATAAAVFQRHLQNKQK